MKKFHRFFVSQFCRIGDRFKPVLIKILPKNFLKKIKKSMIQTVSKGNSSNSRQKYDSNAYPHGVNLVGYIKASMGLGEGCRLIAKALDTTDIPYKIINTKVGNPFNHNVEDWNDKISQKLKYSINIFHINPEQLFQLQIELPQNTWDKRFNIGIWLWELDEIPLEWEKAFSLVDEIWVPSVFCQKAFEKKSPVPVKLIPYGLEAEYATEFEREHLNLPTDKFLFLVMFDTNSTMERKNPIGAIKAYKKAFPPTEKSTGIVIKINNPTPQVLELINAELAGYENVFIIKEVLSKQEVYGLIACCDVFVSLHRSEGFGLVIAEAMLLKTPVIATYWSANADFMSPKTACCVDCELVQIEKDSVMYKSGNKWAEPDLTQAAVFMKLLKCDRSYGYEISQNAFLNMSENYSVKASAEKIGERIKEISNK